MLTKLLFDRAIIILILGGWLLQACSGSIQHNVEPLPILIPDIYSEDRSIDGKAIAEFLMDKLKKDASVKVLSRTQFYGECFRRGYKACDNEDTIKEIAKGMGARWLMAGRATRLEKPNSDQLSFVILLRVQHLYIYDMKYEIRLASGTLKDLRKQIQKTTKGLVSYMHSKEISLN